MSKITIKEFLNDKRNVGIHCKTLNEVKKVVSAITKTGRKFVDEDLWYIAIRAHNYDIVIYNNFCKNGLAKWDASIAHTAKKVYEFNDIDFVTKALSNEQQLRLLEKQIAELKIKIATKPIAKNLTPAEKTILKNLDKRFNYIARDYDGELHVYETEPIKSEYYWLEKSCSAISLQPFNHLFKLINFDNEKACEIKRLIGGK